MECRPFRGRRWALLSILALVRYRRMIPLLFALLLLEHVSRRVILHFIPIVKIGTPPGFYVNLILLAVITAGLALSLTGKEKEDAPN